MLGKRLRSDTPCRDPASPAIAKTATQNQLLHECRRGIEEDVEPTATFAEWRTPETEVNSPLEHMPGSGPRIMQYPTFKMSHITINLDSIMPAHGVTDDATCPGPDQAKTPFGLEAVLKQSTVEPGDAIQRETAHGVRALLNRLPDRADRIRIERFIGIQKKDPAGIACERHRVLLLLGWICEVPMNRLHALLTKVLDGSIGRSGIQHDDGLSEVSDRFQRRWNGAHVVHAGVAHGEARDRRGM